MAAIQHNFGDNEELSAALAQRVADDLRAGLAERGYALLAVSGGRTPASFFRALSRESLDWQQVYVTQVDERWVDEGSEDSNARLIREHLMQNEAAAAHFVSMKTGEDSPFKAEQSAAEKLQAFANGIDVVVLGMGEDGHTASFFPGADTLARALDRSSRALCVAVSPPEAPFDRMTLSLPPILSAKHRYLHIVGPSKQGVLEQAMQAGSERELPVRSVLDSSIDIYYAEQA